jgi:hypothetical protein
VLEKKKEIRARELSTLVIQRHVRRARAVGVYLEKKRVEEERKRREEEERRRREEEERRRKEEEERRRREEEERRRREEEERIRLKEEERRRLEEEAEEERERLRLEEEQMRLEAEIMRKAEEIRRKEEEILQKLRAKEEEQQRFLDQEIKRKEEEIRRKEEEIRRDQERLKQRLRSESGGSYPPGVSEMPPIFNGRKNLFGNDSEELPKTAPSFGAIMSADFSKSEISLPPIPKPVPKKPTNPGGSPPPPSISPELVAAMEKSGMDWNALPSNVRKTIAIKGNRKKLPRTF